jgi:hypothetical protein
MICGRIVGERVDTIEERGKVAPVTHAMYDRTILAC